MCENKQLWHWWRWWIRTKIKNWIKNSRSHSQLFLNLIKNAFCNENKRNQQPFNFFRFFRCWSWHFLFLLLLFPSHSNESIYRRNKQINNQSYSSKLTTAAEAALSICFAVQKQDRNKKVVSTVSSSSNNSSISAESLIEIHSFRVV